MKNLIQVIKYMVAVAIIFSTPACLISIIWNVAFHDVVTCGGYVAIMLMISMILAVYAIEEE
jgi:hypothetical protein